MITHNTYGLAARDAKNAIELRERARRRRMREKVDKARAKRRAKQKAKR